MSKKPQNHGKAWLQSDVNTLEKLAEGNTPTRIIALKIGRTENSIQSKASEEQISLKPVNQSHYNRKK